jgi:hypothetical protein
VPASNSDNRGSSCTEKVRLLEAYRKAAMEWSRATEPRNQTESFIERSQGLREAALSARAAYDDHECAQCKP